MDERSRIRERTGTQVVSEGTKGAVMYTEDVEKKVYKRV